MDDANALALKRALWFVGKTAPSAYNSNQLSASKQCTNAQRKWSFLAAFCFRLLFTDRRRTVTLPTRNTRETARKLSRLIKVRNFVGAELVAGFRVDVNGIAPQRSAVVSDTAPEPLHAGFS